MQLGKFLVKFTICSLFFCVCSGVDPKWIEALKTRAALESEKCFTPEEDIFIIIGWSDMLKSPRLYQNPFDEIQRSHEQQVQLGTRGFQQVRSPQDLRERYETLEKTGRKKELQSILSQQSNQQYIFSDRFKLSLPQERALAHLYKPIQLDSAEGYTGEENRFILDTLMEHATDKELPESIYHDLQRRHRENIKSKKTGFYKGRTILSLMWRTYEIMKKWQDGLERLGEDPVNLTVPLPEETEEIKNEDLEFEKLEKEAMSDGPYTLVEDNLIRAAVSKPKSPGPFQFRTWGILRDKFHKRARSHTPGFHYRSAESIKSRFLDILAEDVKAQASEPEDPDFTICEDFHKRKSSNEKV